MSSHDLQEPLRHLLVFAQRLEKHLLEGEPGKVAADLESIKRSAGRMRRTILDVQELTCLERVALRLEPLGMGQCVRQALDALGPAVHESGAVIEIAELPSVLADESLIVTLVKHLISNGLKFCPRPAQLHIEAEEIDGAWVFGVRDNGPGIDRQYAERIFHPFERIGPPRNDGGSGMGLAICRVIVERHKGDIWVESAPGQGAHFRFRLGTAQ
jgi:light-regulated signal transduction histidine kinase (bacteriophytochrome)